MTLAPSGIAYEDLGALLAHQPGVAKRWHEHLIASPFGTIHAATFSLPRPVGTGLPHPPLYALANFDPLDLTGSIGAEPLGDGSAPVQFPKVNRRAKHDSFLARKREPMPPLPPVLAIAPVPPAEIDASLRSPEPDRFDAYAEYEFPAPVGEHAPERPVKATAANPELESERVFFGARPLAPSGEIKPWRPGEAPVTASQAGETIAPKGVVTGDEARPNAPAKRLKLSGKARAKAEKCLANAVYFEARGEPVRGQIAVAQVVMNRVFSPFYPDTVCEVVYQNADRRNACQFTFACDGIPDVVTEPDAWERAKRIARDMLDGKLWLAEIAKSTHYHAYWVRPDWIGEMRRIDHIGVHIFYRPRNWGDGSDEPHWGDAKTTAAEAKILQKM